MATITRATAKICPLKYLSEGTFVTQEGWQPNYIQVGGEHISRVNIIGIVVEKPTPNTFFIDDGTGSMRVVDFTMTTSTAALQVGDPVLLIARPRKTEDDLFLAAEIVRKKQLVDQPELVEQRQALLQKFIPQEKKVEEEAPPQASSMTGDDILEFLRKKDTGEGCPTDELIEYFGKDVEESIQTLLSMGEIYELRPGMLKVLE